MDVSVFVWLFVGCRPGQLPMSPVSETATGSGHCGSLCYCTVFTFQYKPPLGNSCDLALHKSQ